MIRVLHVLTDTNIGGAGTYVANYIKNHDPALVDPTVLLPKGSAVVGLLAGANCRMIEASIAPDRSLDMKSIGVLRRWIRAGGYDIVHAHGSASARLAAKGLCPCVFTKHTLSKEKAGLKGLVEKWIYRMIGGSAIAVSKAAEENLLALGFRKNHIYTVLNGAEDMGVATPEQQAACKEQFGLSPSDYVVGCIARFAPEKDYPTWMRAAAKVAEACPNARFLLCGDGETLEEIKSLSAELNIQERCLFAGRVMDCRPAYHAMDLYCITSLEESYGLTLVEAWSAGLPTVTTDAAGFCEISENEETSLICRRGDAKSIAAAILRLYHHREEARTLGNNGNTRYYQQYSAKQFARNVEAVYQELAD